MTECIHCGSEEVEVFLEGIYRIFHCLFCDGYFEDDDRPYRKFVIYDDE